MDSGEPFSPTSIDSRCIISLGTRTVSLSSLALVCDSIGGNEVVRMVAFGPSVGWSVGRAHAATGILKRMAPRQAGLDIYCDGGPFAPISKSELSPSPWKKMMTKSWFCHHAFAQFFCPVFQIFPLILESYDKLSPKNH